MPSMPRAGAGVCHNMCARKKKGFLGGVVGGCPVPCALEWYQTGLGGVEEAVQQDSMDSRCYPVLKTLLLCWLSDSAACNLQFVNLPFHLRTGLTVPVSPGRLDLDESSGSWSVVAQWSPPLDGPDTTLFIPPHPSAGGTGALDSLPSRPQRKRSQRILETPPFFPFRPGPPIHALDISKFTCHPHMLAPSHGVARCSCGRESRSELAEIGNRPFRGKRRNRPRTNTPSDEATGLGLTGHGRGR